MSPSTARAVRNTPVRFTSSTRCHSANEVSCTCPTLATPALAYRTSIRPCREIVSATAASIDASSDTSACRVAPRRSTPTTVAPSCGEALGARGAEAGARAGDQRDLPRQPPLSQPGTRLARRG